VVAFRDVIAKEDALVVANLRGAGAIIGRTNTPAFSMRIFSENALHGRTRDPRDPQVTPGGSSQRRRRRGSGERHRAYRPGQRYRWLSTNSRLLLRCGRTTRRAGTDSLIQPKRVRCGGDRIAAHVDATAAYSQRA
jgi:hypothetical protein